MKGVKLAGYAAWFFAAFIIGIFVTFPVDEMKGMIINMADDALGKGKQGPYGVDPKLEIGSLSMSGFGVKATHVSLQIGSRDPDPGPVLEAEKVTFNVRPWIFLTKNKTFLVSADLYGGSVDVKTTVDDKGQVLDANVDVDSVDLGKFPLAVQKLGIPIGGKLNVKGKVDLGATPEKDGEGNLSINVKNISVGPGDLKLAAAFGGFQVPTIDLGTLSGELPIKQGKGTLQNLKLDGKDIQAEVSGDIFVKGKLNLTRLDLDGWFQPMPAFLERETKFKSLLELGEQMGGQLGGGMSLSKAKDEDGRYWFGLKGTAQSPLASLARDNGKRAKMKSSSPSGPSSPPPPLTPSTPKVGRVPPAPPPPVEVPDDSKG